MKREETKLAVKTYQNIVEGGGSEDNGKRGGV